MNPIITTARRVALEARSAANRMNNEDLRALLVAANNAQMAAYHELARRGQIKTK